MNRTADRGTSGSPNARGHAAAGARGRERARNQDTRAGATRDARARIGDDCCWFRSRDAAYSSTQARGGRCLFWPRPSGMPALGSADGRLEFGSKVEVVLTGNSPATGHVEISGTAEVGETLTARTVVEDENGARGEGQRKSGSSRTERTGFRIRTLMTYTPWAAALSARAPSGKLSVPSGLRRSSVVV